MAWHSQIHHQEIANALQDAIYPHPQTVSACNVLFSFQVADCYAVRCRPTVSNA